MSHGPQLAFSDDPELYNPPTATEPYANKTGVREERTARAGQSRICGLRRATFWLVLLLIFVIIVAAVGGGVGGSIAVQNAKSQNAPESPVTVTATATRATATESSSTSSNPSSPSATATLTTTTNSFPSSTFTTYTPLAPSDVPLIDNTCPGGTISSLGKTYDCSEQRDYVQNDITGIIAYSLSACIDACTTYNLVHADMDPPGCQAVVLSSSLKDSYNSNKGANCWLKLSAPDGDKDLSFQKDAIVAVLQS